MKFEIMIIVIMIYISAFLLQKIAKKSKKNKNNIGINANIGSNYGNINIEKEYLKSENEIIKDIINSELEKNKYDGNNIAEVEKKRFKVTIIFSILNFIFVALLFFHLPLYVYLLEVINIIFYITFTNRYNTVKYLEREIKARPDDDISNIVSSILASGTVGKTKKIIKETVIILASTLIPLIIFIKPITFYEKNEDGYYLRFYTTGIIQSKEITIPETYKGKDVVGIRGDVFANIHNVQKINLPNTIKTIRGKAFKNDTSLKEIELPDNLTYLGGSAFKNCTSLKSITIPQGVTVINGNTFENCDNLSTINLHDNISEIHGETFVNCKSLVSIKLPSKITEVRGNTFENCRSLKSIDIPDGVTRIGGHAFYGCSSLSNVTVPSTVEEIGSSAFRLCTSLKSIKIPRSASVKENAFKESPTKVLKYNTDGSSFIDDDESKGTNTIKNTTTNSITNKTLIKTPKVIKRNTNNTN